MESSSINKPRTPEQWRKAIEAKERMCEELDEEIVELEHSINADEDEIKLMEKELEQALEQVTRAEAERSLAPKISKSEKRDYNAFLRCRALVRNTILHIGWNISLVDRFPVSEENDRQAKAMMYADLHKVQQTWYRHINHTRKHSPKWIVEKIFDAFKKHNSKLEVDGIDELYLRLGEVIGDDDPSCE